ncbi:MAG TPA: tRNA (adenosine(37)-N6)-dimethylallyltransferase MiaA [Candidatus Adamsella sp.]|nr:tRNA (adenosine(37)-N6)-dimethylallyltransferase MiaA [Candidatus Adamsella sp.]
MKVLAIVGSTASGKTAVSVELAKKIGGEIVSADSRLIYRDFDIGTAKPTAEERCGIPHYMIDIIPPERLYSAGDYKKDASEAVEKIISKGRIPIVVGGTGFYVRSLLGGLDIPDVPADENFRAEMDKFVEDYGRQALYDKLAAIDKTTADKLHYNDNVRVTRALEIFHATGKTMSEISSMSKPPYEVFYAGLNARDRAYLYDRANRRVDKMIDSGLVDEVHRLVQKYGRTLPILKTLGYKEICEYFDGKISLEEAVGLIKKHTRNYAKRQLTWFRANPEIHWYYIDEMTQEEIVEKIIREYNV